MSDIHQATYDAVRSKISNGDIGGAIETAIRDMNLSHYAEMAGYAAQEAACEYARPSVVYKPTISIDGNQYSVLYGENLQDGCAGFGDSIKQRCMTLTETGKNPSSPVKQ